MTSASRETPARRCESADASVSVLQVLCILGESLRHILDTQFTAHWIAPRVRSGQVRGSSPSQASHQCWITASGSRHRQPSPGHSEIPHMLPEHPWTRCHDSSDQSGGYCTQQSMQSGHESSSRGGRLSHGRGFILWVVASSGMANCTVFSPAIWHVIESDAPQRGAARAPLGDPRLTPWLASDHEHIQGHGPSPVR